MMRNLSHLQRGGPRHFQRGFLGAAISIGASLLASDRDRSESRKGRKASEAALLRQEARLDAQEARAAFLFEEFKTTFLPVERKLAEQAARGLNVEQFTGQAVADVQQSFDKAEEIATRNLQRFGVNPNTGRFAGLNRKIELARASSEAGAVTSTRRFIEEEDFRRRAAVANLGRGLPALSVRAGGGGPTGAPGFAFNAAAASKSAGQTAEFFSRLPFDDILKRISGRPRATGNPNTSTNINEFPSFDEGGLVGPEGGVVEAGEVVIPAETVLRKGTEFFAKLVNQSQGLPRAEAA